MPEPASKNDIRIPLPHSEILADYRLAYRSRQVSLVGRREVMSGKAKFGIFGDGKEVVQLAMARFFKPGDFRSGYYRDQTFMFAIGELSMEQFFAQLYAHADIQFEPATGGRAMNAHFATRSLNPDGSWKHIAVTKNSSADISPTASQMPRLVGLAYASRLYRELSELQQFTQFSHNGDEVAFGTIGNASTSEGMFWEAVNAIGVLRCPAVITIYDDEYGISVPNTEQMVKADLSDILAGFQRTPECIGGFDLYTVAGWDYPALLGTYQQATKLARQDHVPALIHVTQLTQPQGHSTSGSHERYKSAQRLAWEEECDGVAQFRQLLLSQDIISEKDLENVEVEERKFVEMARKKAWDAYISPILSERQQAIDMLEKLGTGSIHTSELFAIRSKLAGLPNPLRRDLLGTLNQAIIITRDEPSPNRDALLQWLENFEKHMNDRYSKHLYAEINGSALNLPLVPPVYLDEAPEIMGFELLNSYFDAVFAIEPRLIAFGEDVGKLGDVNQGFRGLQDKYGVLRISDTGIRETTIIGQAIGLALRGLRPIAEIQYLDYVLYCLQILSDDLATLHWRTAGGQKAPIIVRTRGHRLEGIWHSGSLLAGIINLVRGMYVLVPRDMTHAAGFYNTLLKGEEPGLVIEVLNGYRLKERLPQNLAKFTVSLGVPEILCEGEDITLVTYGACCRIVMEAADILKQVDIQAEVIDVQSLLPFDRFGRITESLKKTGHIVFIDEDVPGGTTAYMLQKVLEEQGGFQWLDSAPRTITGKPHRPAYGSDSDYWSKPNLDQIFKTVYEVISETNPKKYPAIYS
jgi:pyruvate/2-oxoglutarate/acetoin dehydrogenase E1 component/TPP-dependent pyruvate/acetoin dehydrogenase alpha subunit